MLKNKKEETKYCFIVILWRNYQANNLFIFRDLLNFTVKCVGGQIKAFSFLFCAASDAKSTEGREHLYT